MDGIAIAQWAMTGVLAVGLYLTIRHNGKKGTEIEKREAERWGSLTNEVKNMGETLAGVKRDVSEIKDSINGQKIHCVKVTSDFAQRIITLENKRKRK